MTICSSGISQTSLSYFQLGTFQAQQKLNSISHGYLSIVLYFFLAASLRFLICWVDNLDILPKRIRGLRRNMNSNNNNPSVAWCLKTDLELIHTTENRQTWTNLLNPNVDLKYAYTCMHTHKLNSNFFE